MLVYPQIRHELREEGCRIARWIPAERFAPYFARTTVLPRLPPQEESDDSQGSSSPENASESDIAEGVCGWRGCGIRFSSVARLSAHIARAHAHVHRDGLFYCGWKDCLRPQRGFNARYKMLVHVRTHTNERPHTCNQCQKSFSRAENLKIHLRSHSGEKPYVCPYEGCGKAYSNSSDRFKHTRTHTIDKPYFCKVLGCNKRYTDPSSLRKHVKTYRHFTNERDMPRRKSSDDRQSSDSLSPTKENYVQKCISYSTACIPTVSYNSLTNYPDALGTPLSYSPTVDRIYGRPVDHVYPIRVPSHEMTYMDYTQMYDNSYKSYYSSGINYSVLKPVNEKVFKYDEHIKIESKVPENCEEGPLNLICAKRSECKPFEELVRHTDLPLDLSTKS